LLHNLEGFLKEVKALGLLAKLDTNGSMPAELKNLLGKGLLDYVSMDIKSGPSGYDKAAGTTVDIEKIRQSVSLIRDSGIDYEFRCTVVPKLHGKKDLLEIGEWLRGSKKFFLQQFNSSLPLLDPALQGTSPFSALEMRNFALFLKPFFGEVALRGI
jgi:pyruvate formate lyase activating enzyme